MRVYVLNTLISGMDTVSLIQSQLPITGLIGLSDRPKDDKISGFAYQKKFCREQKIDFVEVDSYSLAHLEDRKRILDLDIDVLIVAGWQRLIPDWLIQHCNSCVIGIHGSPLGITKGRGRSPQNWALMMGCEQFNISIFEIDNNIDSGRIIASLNISPIALPAQL